MSSRLVYVTSNDKISFFLISAVFIHHIFFIHSSTDGRKGTSLTEIVEVEMREPA
jgi:hypothetical protein